MIPPDPCPTPELLFRLLLGHLSEQEAGPLEEHLACCPRCEALAAQASEDDLVMALRSRSPIMNAAALPEVRELIGRAQQLRPAALATPPPRDTPSADLLHPPLEAGEIGRVGHYRILSILGQGGMGVVYRALDVRLKRQVAVKMILPRAGGPSPEGLARFRREAEVIARLEHPNVVKIHEIGEHESSAGSVPYLVMELVEGGSLAQRLAVRPLEPRPAAELVQALAGGVAAAHRQGVIHRDLKPANVLLPAAGPGSPPEQSELSAAKITDFGLAKRVQQEQEPGVTFATHPDAILGTPNYVAPEQVQAASGPVGPAADVYALGAILYESLTGRPPFQAASVLETLDQVRHQEPVPPVQLRPGLPRDLQTICLKCLQKDARRRYASAQDLADDLGRYQRGEPIRARAVSTWERARKWMWRNPLGASLVGVIVVATLTVVAGMLVYQERLRKEVERAEANATRAQKEEKRSDEQYRAAREAINQMLARLRKKHVSGVPELKQLQREQMEDALKFYQVVFAYADDPNPQVRFDVALAHRQAGDMQQLLGRAQEAQENYDRAVVLLEALTEEYPAEMEYRAHLGTTLLNLAVLDRHLNAVDRAEKGLLRAIEVFERGGELFSNPDHWVGSLAKSRHNLGTLYEFTGRPALGQYEEALKLHLRLVRKHPESEPYAVTAAETYIHLGRVYQWSKEHTLDDAEKAYQEAERLLAPIAKKHPEVLDYPTSLAALYINWATLLDLEKEHEAVIKRVDQALELLKAVLAREANWANAQAHRLPAHGVRAQALDNLKRYRESVADWEQVVRLSSPSDRPEYRLNLIQALLNAEDHARSVTEAGTFLEEKKRAADALYNAASVQALASRLARKGAAAVAEKYAVEAVRLLKEAQSKGYFADAKHVEQLKKDEGLDALRERADFEEFVQSLGK